MKVGEIHTNKLGDKLEFIVQLPKFNWRTDLSLNYSVSKVFGVLFNDTPVQVAYHNKTKSFTKFVQAFNDKYITKNLTIKNGDFDEMVVYGVESENGMTGKNIHYTNGVCEFMMIEDVEVCLVPWHDGVMLQSVVVPKHMRNKGLGSNVMICLETISEITNIPVYLIPYPSETFNPSDEGLLVFKLKTFYENFGYDTALEHGNKIWSKIMCNME